MALSLDIAFPRLDAIMERASRRLVAMQYAACEWGCLEAVAVAREAGAWDYYSRIVLPLQEARRQRRMIAGEGGIGMWNGWDAWPPRVSAGFHKCLLVGVGIDREEAGRLDAAMHLAGADVEVLKLLPPRDHSGNLWGVTSVRGPAVEAEVPPPPRRYTGERGVATGMEAEGLRWFEAAAEALGDAAIAAVTAPLGTVARVDALEHMLDAARTHEKLHQRLAEAAAAVAAPRRRAGRVCMSAH